MTLTFKQLQDEQKAWILHNFGPGQPHQPLLGMVEELGELSCALMPWNAHDILDAVADVTIFAADYATKNGWDMEEFDVGTPSGCCSVEEALRCLFEEIGSLSHHQLKSEQSIRGSKEEHDRRGRESLRRVLFDLNTAAAHFGKTLMEVVEPVWNEVKKRDFKAFPTNGLTS